MKRIRSNKRHPALSLHKESLRMISGGGRVTTANLNIITDGLDELGIGDLARVFVGALAQPQGS